MLITFMFADMDPLVYILELILGPAIPPPNPLVLFTSGDWVLGLRYLGRITMILVYSIELSRIIAFCGLTMLPTFRAMINSLKFIGELSDVHPKIGVLYHSHLQIIWASIKPVLEPSVTGLFFCGIYVGGIAIYLTINGYNVLAFSLYCVCPVLSILQIITTGVATPLCILISELSVDLIGKLESSSYGTGLRTKYYRKRAKACKPIKVNFSVNGFRVSAMLKETKTKYYAGEVEWVSGIINNTAIVHGVGKYFCFNLLFSLPRFLIFSFPCRGIDLRLQS